MPNKPFKHTDLSNKLCTVCRRKLKKNLIAKIPEAKICHSCKKSARTLKIKNNLLESDRRRGL